MNHSMLTQHESAESTSCEARVWKPFHEKYTEQVFCPVLFQDTLAEVVNAVRPPRILDMGCGPTSLLLNEIAKHFGDLKVEIELYASDFSPEMLEAAQNAAQIGGITFVRVDHRQLGREFGRDFFDTVVSINSILPEQRADVDRIFSQVINALKPGGRLVALLPAFETSHMARDHWGMDIRIDDRNHREYDTTGWQCYHTADDICAQMQRHKFGKFDCRPHKFTSQHARNVIRRVYGQSITDEALVKYPLFEHFLVAEKPA